MIQIGSNEVIVTNLAIHVFVIIREQMVELVLIKVNAKLPQHVAELWGIHETYASCVNLSEHSSHFLPVAGDRLPQSHHGIKKWCACRPSTSLQHQDNILRDIFVEMQLLLKYCCIKLIFNQVLLHKKDHQ